MFSSNHLPTLLVSNRLLIGNIHVLILLINQQHLFNTLNHSVLSNISFCSQMFCSNEIILLPSLRPDQEFPSFLRVKATSIQHPPWPCVLCSNLISTTLKLLLFPETADPGPPGCLPLPVSFCSNPSFPHILSSSPLTWKSFIHNAKYVLFIL